MQGGARMFADTFSNVLFTVLMGLVATFGGIYIRRLQLDINNLQARVDDIVDEYQRREDARRDQDQIMEILREMKRSIERISDKLDKKADRP